MSWKSPAVRDAFAVGMGMEVDAEIAAESAADFGGAAGADAAS